MAPRARAEKLEAAPKKKAAPAGAPKARCGVCGHWSVATEYGLDDRSGYCDRWEKLTDRDFVCEEFVSREKFQELQKELVEQNEEFMDEDTG